MKRSVILAALLLFVFSVVQAEEAVPLKNGWQFDFSTAIPLFKVVESEGGGSKMDIFPLLGIGGGLTFYWGKPDAEKIVSINFPTLALSKRVDDESKMDLTLIFDVGALDNILRLGVGYEFGPTNVSRVIGLFSIGVEF